MITVHHLNNSRSQRVLWLLEELELPYRIEQYQRDATTNLAPESLLKVHPLGKSPVIDDDGVVIAETGAIIEYVLEHHGAGRLKPAPGTDDYRRYQYWLHAAEGSYMPPLVLSLMMTRMETAPMPFFVRPIAKRLVKGVRDAYLDHTLDGLFRYVDAELSAREWLAGDEFTAADVIMSFPLEASLQRMEFAKRSAAIKRFVDAIHHRPAYIRALEKGGEYAYA